MQGIALCNLLVFKGYAEEKQYLQSLAEFVANFHGSVTYSLHLAKFRMGEQTGIWADYSDDEMEYPQYKRRRITNDFVVGKELQYTTKGQVVDLDE